MISSYLRTLSFTFCTFFHDFTYVIITSKSTGTVPNLDHIVKLLMLIYQALIYIFDIHWLQQILLLLDKKADTVEN